MKRCPKCGCERFYVTARVIQDWIVDGKGNYIGMYNDCPEVSHYPDDYDMWICCNCYHEAEGTEFEIRKDDN